LEDSLNVSQFKELSRFSYSCISYEREGKFSGVFYLSEVNVKRANDQFILLIKNFKNK